MASRGMSNTGLGNKPFFRTTQFPSGSGLGQGVLGSAQ